MSSLIDISPVIGPGIAVWPGDVAYQRSVALDMESGANLTLSSIQTTLHLGAHADGPNHYEKNGVGIDERALDLYFGACQVVTVEAKRGFRIHPRDLNTDLRTPRVLIRTDTYPDPDNFNEDFAALSAELVDYLAGQGVQLVGIDTPSIDLFADRILESHQRIAANDMAILEGLVLNHVTDGEYTLIALPLKLRGADASPVRAALLPR